MIFNFAGIKMLLTDRLRLFSDWVNVLYFGVYERIIDMVAFTLEKVVYIAEFYYREANFRYARKLNSVSNIAYLLGYSPKRSIGAKGTLFVSGSPSFSSTYKYLGYNVLIKKYTKFTDEDNELEVYCAADTIYYRNTVGSLSVPIKQGTPKEYFYTAIGQPNEIVYLYSSSIDEEDINVFVVDINDNILYECTKTENLYFEEDTTTIFYEVTTSSDFSSVQIKFGDGQQIKKLPTGERLLFQYAETLGENGDITSSNIIDRPVDSLEDEYGTEVLLYMRNEDGITGGVGIEDIESIRQNARKLFQTGSRCVTTNDWTSLINSVPYVDKSIAWSIYDEGGSTLIEDQNSVYLTALTTTGEHLTTSQKTEIENDYLKPAKTITEIITWYDTEKVYAHFIIDAKLLPTESIPTAETEIKNTLYDTFSATTVDYQQNIYESNYIRVIDSIDSIVYHSTDMYNMEKNFNFLTEERSIIPSFTSSDTTLPENQVYIVPDTLAIYAQIKTSGVWEDPVKIGEDTSGVISSLIPTTYTISGSVNYVSNKFNFYVQGGKIVSGASQNPDDAIPEGYLLNIHYKTQDGNNELQKDIRLPRRYQITDMDFSFIDTNLSYL
jgi:hypothetical protein